MPNYHQIKLPKPSDWQELQRLTCDLFKEIWHNQYITEFGTLGQRQDGIDIYGVNNKYKSFEGIQCKCVKRLTEKNIEDDYNKSKFFNPKLSNFIIVTTVKRNVKLQKKASQITIDNEYPCHVLFWEDITQRLASNPEVLKKYYSDFIIFESIYDVEGKVVKILIDNNKYEILISRIKKDVKYYGNMLVISDLQSNKCITYHPGSHWSRLDNIVGLTSFDAFLVSKWLNSFKNIEKLFRSGNTVFTYKLSNMDIQDAQNNGFNITNSQVFVRI